MGLGCKPIGYARDINICLKYKRILIFYIVVKEDLLRYYENEFKMLILTINILVRFKKLII